MAWKKFIDTGAGVIGKLNELLQGSSFRSCVDADYRGNVGVILFNHSKQDFEGKQNYAVDLQ